MNDNIMQNHFPDRNYTRLTGFDYSSPGAYFVTICVHKKQCLFGAIENGAMLLNQYGEIIRNCWKNLQHHYVGINNQLFTVMPNHVHGIIEIIDTYKRSGSKPDPTFKYPLSEIIRAFKTYSSRGINEFRHSSGTTVWQRSFYEHIIRTEEEYREIGEYIAYNPAKWSDDDENPCVLTKHIDSVGSRFRRP